jgi:hypothetical protein
MRKFHASRLKNQQGLFATRVLRWTSAGRLIILAAFKQPMVIGYIND